VSVQQVP